MKTIFFVIILLFSGFLHAQEHVVHPFEDYSTCLTGFKNGAQELVLEAHFERVEQIHLSQKQVLPLLK